MVLTFPRSIEAAKKAADNPNVAKLKDAQLRGYEWLKSVGEASTREYSGHFQIGYKTGQRHLAVMKELNLIRDNGEDAMHYTGQDSEDTYAVDPISGKQIEKKIRIKLSRNHFEALDLISQGFHEQYVSRYNRILKIIERRQMKI